MILNLMHNKGGIDETTYRYESHGGDFVTELTVNEAGFVTRYPDLWEIE
jgi:hypothetical protein